MTPLQDSEHHPAVGRYSGGYTQQDWPQIEPRDDLPRWPAKQDSQPGRRSGNRHPRSGHATTGVARTQTWACHTAWIRPIKTLGPTDMGTMRWRRPRRYLLCLLVLAAGTLPAAGCSSDPSGPLSTLMDGGQPALAVGGGPVTPGQPQDGEAVVVNSASTPVTITAVSVIPIPGVPAAQLADAGVVTTGKRRIWHQPAGTGIVFGITGQVPGRDYAVAGLRITYTYNGHSYTTSAWAGNEACIVPDMNPANLAAASAACNGPFNTKVNTAIEQMAGLT